MRRSHNPEVAGSSPVPANKQVVTKQQVMNDSPEEPAFFQSNLQMELQIAHLTGD